MLAVLALAYLLSSAAVAGPFDGECSLWNDSSIPVAASSPQYDLYDLTSSTVEAGMHHYFPIFLPYDVFCYVGMSPSRVHSRLQGLLQSASEGTLSDGCITRML